MSDIGSLEVGLFTWSCVTGLPGGLLLLGGYGFPSSPAWGIALLILSAMFGAIFIALVHDEPQQSN